MRAISAIWARISLAPSAQLSPIENGAAWRTEFQNAAGVWPESSRPERSVMVPEIITGTRTAARFGDVGDGGDRRLGVERVEDRLDQEQVGAALDQPLDLLGIGAAQLVEGDGAEAGIGDVGRDRGGAIGRPERAGDEARAAVLRLRDIGGRAREPGALDVELMRDALHAVVGLRDAGRGERVGRDDVGAGAEIGEMDVADLGRLAEDEQIVVAAHFAVPGVEARAAIAFLVEPERLDHGAHGAVEHQDALGRDAAQRLLGGRHRELGRKLRHYMLSDCSSRRGLRHNRSRRQQVLKKRSLGVASNRITPPLSLLAAARAGGTRRRPGRRGSWCRSGNR